MLTPSEILQGDVMRRMTTIPGLLTVIGPNAIRKVTAEQCQTLDGIASDEIFSNVCKAFMRPGANLHKGQSANTKARLAKLEALLILHRTTKTTHSEIGQAYYDDARVVDNMECLAHDDEALLTEVCEKVAVGGGCVSSTEQQLMEGASGPAAFAASPNRPPRLSLADLVAAAGRQGRNTEEQLQTVLVPALKTVGAAVGSDTVLVDTSSRGFQQPIAKPGATSFAVAGPLTYATVVVFWEFTLTDRSSARWEALGQHVGRARSCLDYQPSRQFMVAVTVTMNSIELFRISRFHGDLSVVRSGPLPFSFDPTSPGLRWLVRLMRTPMAQLGYTPLPKPSIISTKGMDIQVGELIGRGTGHGSQSLVFHATVDGGGAIIKLNPYAQEGRLLETLTGVNGIVQLLEVINVADKQCHYAGAPVDAVIISPYARPLCADDDLPMFVQVVYDVTTGLDGAAARGVAQRDVTPHNFGVGPDGRGVLYDFSAGKYIEGHDWTAVDMQDPNSRASNLDNIIGTTLWAPVSILEGYAHTVSSQLEGLFLSILSIACNDHLDGYKRVGSSTHEWSNFRQAAMLRRDLLEERRVPIHLRALIRMLHDLFYPMVRPSGVHKVPKDREFMMREYRMDVTAAEVQQVCIDITLGKEPKTSLC